jgi:signal transduction histidine kinase
LAASRPRDQRLPTSRGHVPYHRALHCSRRARRGQSRIIAAVDHARRRLERDLDDGLQQRLLYLKLKTAWPWRHSPHGHDLRCELAGIAEGVAEALENVREISRGLHPAILSQRGLPPAVKALARSSPVPVTLRADLHGRLPDAVEIGGYYIISEALANAAKQAHATVVDVSIKKHGRSLDIAVRDNGVGGADTSGPGLTGLADRVDAPAGRMQLRSPPGHGTSSSSDSRREPHPAGA